MPRERNSIAGSLYNSFYCNGIFFNWWSEIRWSIRFLIKFWIPPSVSHFSKDIVQLLVDMCPAGWKTFLIWENSHATAFRTHSVFFLPSVFSLNSLKSQAVFWNLALKYIFSPYTPNSVTIQSCAHTIVTRIFKGLQTHHNLMARSMSLPILSSGNAPPTISTSWTLIHPSKFSSDTVFCTNPSLALLLPTRFIHRCILRAVRVPSTTRMAEHMAIINQTWFLPWGS